MFFHQNVSHSLKRFLKTKYCTESCSLLFSQLFPVYYMNMGPNTGCVFSRKAGPNVQTKAPKPGGLILHVFEGRNIAKVKVQPRYLGNLLPC